MSLKAYDGMMTRKGLKFVQDKIKENLPKFREASINKLAQEYADVLIRHVDEIENIQLIMAYVASKEVYTKKFIEDIKVDEDTTLLSYIYQCSEMFSESYFVNDYTVNLNITLEVKDENKLLVYPNIIVPEHRKILLSFLDDWYCQDQSDPDENVPEDEWEEREKDWWDFNETQGLCIKIELFDPKHHWDSLNKHFRGEELINKILEFIPDDEKRKKQIAQGKILKDKMKNFEGDKKEKFNKIWKLMSELTRKGNTEVDDYIKSNEITLINIDEDFIENAKVL